MQPDLTFWTIGALAAFLVGVAKTGVPGMGILVVPIVAMIYPAKQSVGALLPLLVCGDIAGVLFFRRHANWSILWKLMPWTLAGIALGYLSLQHMNDALLKPILGGVVLVLVAVELARRKFTWLNVPHAGAFTAFSGALTGLATTIGNVAGPIANIFMIGKGFAKKEFMGTVAWYFLVINSTKVPLFWHLGMISKDTLRFNAYVLPALVVGGIAGRLLLQKISDKVFQTLVLTLAAAAALKLLWDGLAS